MNLTFIKKKKFYIPALSVLIIGGLIGYGQYKKATAPPSYETVKVERGDLVQTVEATGKIEAVDDLALRFEIPGIVGGVQVKEGVQVKKGQLLAGLRLNDLNAAVAQARANLDKQLAGATEEDKKYYAAALESARIALDQAKIDADNSIRKAQAALETAQNNLKLAEGADNSQIVAQAYESTVVVLQATLPKLDDALTQADNILGIDNNLANNDIRAYLSIMDSTQLSFAQDAYHKAREARSKARTAIAHLTSKSAPVLIDEALKVTEETVLQTNTLMTQVSKVLSVTPALGTLTQASLDSKKSTVELVRSALNAQLTSLTNQKQAINNAKNSLEGYTIAYNKALKDLDEARTNAGNNIKLKEVALSQAQANYDAKIKPPRAVDVASYRAALAQAVANRDKGYIRAPIDGVVTKINKKIGELVSSADVMINLLSPRYEVTVDISEVDIGKLQVNDPVIITLDAFGTDNKITGKIISIEPGPTIIQEVVYYKVHIGLDDTKVAVKPGLTANVSIKTEERKNAFYLPSRAVKFDEDGGRYVKVLENGEEKDYPVQIGLKANEGRLEVVEGIEVGQEVILSKTEKK